MSKQKVPDNFMNEFLKSGGRADPSEHVANTQKRHSGDTEVTDYKGFKASDLEQLSFRMSPEDKERLRQHFDSLGLTVSAGLRMVLKRYMRDEGIHHI